MTAGAATSATAISTNAMISLRERSVRKDVFIATACSMSGSPPKQSGGPDQEHDCHDDENHRVGGLREEHFGQSLDHAEAKARENSADDRSHAADHHHREHDDDQVRTHLRGY